MVTAVKCERLVNGSNFNELKKLPRFCTPASAILLMKIFLVLVPTITTVYSCRNKKGMCFIPFKSFSTTLAAAFGTALKTLGDQGLSNQRTSC